MARNKDIVTRSVVCPNEHCGGTVYEKDYSRNDGGKLVPVWKCTNCLRETPLTSPHRRTNHQKAVEAWRRLQDAWKPVNESLLALVDAKTVKSGAYMVYSSSYNYHMDKLLLNEHPTNFDVRYHIEKAKDDFAKAQAFVAEEKEKSCPFKAGYSFQMPSLADLSLSHGAPRTS